MTHCLRWECLIFLGMSHNSGFQTLLLLIFIVFIWSSVIHIFLFDDSRFESQCCLLANAKQQRWFTGSLILVWFEHNFQLVIILLFSLVDHVAYLWSQSNQKNITNQFNSVCCTRNLERNTPLISRYMCCAAFRRKNSSFKTARISKLSISEQ